MPARIMRSVWCGSTAFKLNQSQRSLRRWEEQGGCCLLSSATILASIPFSVMASSVLGGPPNFSASSAIDSGMEAAQRRSSDRRRRAPLLTITVRTTRSRDARIPDVPDESGRRGSMRLARNEGPLGSVCVFRRAGSCSLPPSHAACVSAASGLRLTVTASHPVTCTPVPNASGVLPSKSVPFEGDVLSHAGRLAADVCSYNTLPHAPGQASYAAGEML